jgi:molybdate transport system substrate-binding protein
VVEHDARIKARVLVLVEAVRVTSTAGLATKPRMTSAHPAVTRVLATFAALFALLACNSQRSSSEPAPGEAPIKIEAPARTPEPEPAPVHVAAASDLTHAFGDLGPLFEAETKRKVVFSFGASGLLTQQIREGAPFDMLASANVGFTDKLIKEGQCDGTTQAKYARGRLVVWTKKGLVEPPKKLSDLKSARFKRIAIANPEHAPYGKAAQQALEHEKLWGALQPRIVYGENIKQTQQFAQSGNAEAALVSQSLVTGTDDGVALPVDESLHDPIDQALVVCNHGKNTEGGRAFAKFVVNDKGREVLKKYGFELPGAVSAAP